MGPATFIPLRAGVGDGRGDGVDLFGPDDPGLACVRVERRRGDARDGEAVRREEFMGEAELGQHVVARHGVAGEAQRPVRGEVDDSQARGEQHRRDLFDARHRLVDLLMADVGVTGEVGCFLVKGSGGDGADAAVHGEPGSCLRPFDGGPARDGGRGAVGKGREFGNRERLVDADDALRDRLARRLDCVSDESAIDEGEGAVHDIDAPDDDRRDRATERVARERFGDDLGADSGWVAEGDCDDWRCAGHVCVGRSASEIE